MSKKTMFQEKLGDGTLEVRNFRGELLGRKSVNLDDFSVSVYQEHLRKGYTLSLTKIPLEFDGLPVIEKMENAATRKSPDPIRVSPPAKPITSAGDLFDKPADTLVVLQSKTLQSTATKKPRITQSWGSDVDMSYSRYFKAAVRERIADHTSRNIKSIHDYHKISELGLVSDKLQAFLDILGIGHIPRSINFPKMSLRFFTGYIYHHNRDAIQ